MDRETAYFGEIFTAKFKLFVITTCFKNQGVYNSWNDGISLNLYGPGNFCAKCRWSTALVSSHDKTGYRITYL